MLAALPRNRNAELVADLAYEGELDLVAAWYGSRLSDYGVNEERVLRSLPVESATFANQMPDQVAPFQSTILGPGSSSCTACPCQRRPVPPESRGLAARLPRGYPGLP